MICSVLYESNTVLHWQLSDFLLQFHGYRSSIQAAVCSPFECRCILCSQQQTCPYIFNLTACANTQAAMYTGNRLFKSWYTVSQQPTHTFFIQPVL